MPAIIYEDSDAPFTGRPVPYERQDAVRHWSRHVANQFYLEFVAVHPSTTNEEKRQANHELVICLRKQEHWKRHSNWDPEQAAREMERVRSMWSSARRET